MADNTTNNYDLYTVYNKIVPRKVRNNNTIKLTMPTNTVENLLQVVETVTSRDGKPGIILMPSNSKFNTIFKDTGIMECGFGNTVSATENLTHVAVGALYDQQCIDSKVYTTGAVYLYKRLGVAGKFELTDVLHAPFLNINKFGSVLAYNNDASELLVMSKECDTVFYYTRASTKSNLNPECTTFSLDKHGRKSILKAGVSNNLRYVVVSKRVEDGFMLYIYDGNESFTKVNELSFNTSADVSTLDVAVSSNGTTVACLLKNTDTGITYLSIITSDSLTSITLHDTEISRYGTMLSMSADDKKLYVSANDDTGHDIVVEYSLTDMMKG